MVQNAGHPDDAETKEVFITPEREDSRKESGASGRDAESCEVRKGKSDSEMSIGSFRDLTEGVFEDLFDKKDDEVEEEKPKIPDGGYGWFVVLGCFLSHVIIGGFERNDGVYFLQFRARFGESAQLTSWPGALVSTIRLFLGPVASAICNLYSVRLTTMVGALILTVAQILNAFTPNFYFLFFSHAFLQGIGRGLMYAPSLIIISMYFDKHQGLAAGLGSSGVGVGTFCIVPFTQFLFETCGFQGTFLIMAGIALNGTVVAMLYRPLSVHYKFTQQTRKTNPAKIVPKEEDELSQLSTGVNPITAEPKHIPSQTEKDDSKSPTKIADHQKLIKKEDGCCMSSLKIFFPTEDRGKDGKKKKKLFNFGLLKDPSFLMFCISICLFTSAFKAAFTFIPALVKSKNISESDAALVLSISGVFDTIGRIVSGLLLDRPFLRQFRLLFYNAFVFAIATVSFILPSLENFASFTIMCSLYGTLTGAYISQKSVVLVDILGIENMSSSFGLLICFQAIGTCVGPPLSGAIRDAFGGFEYAFYLGGCFMIGAGLMMIVSIIFLKIKIRRQKNIQESTG